ncbi:MAG: hypothetical protein RR461_06115 [Angelakisella sp.]
MKLTSGTITIPIERDGVMTGTVTLNPEDVGFAERFYALTEGLREREQAYNALLENADVQLGDKLRYLGEVCSWMKEQMDSVFGVGCSEAVFGEGCTLELFRQFFAGIEPIIRKSRSSKVQKYTGDSGDVME